MTTNCCIETLHKYTLPKLPSEKFEVEYLADPVTPSEVCLDYPLAATDAFLSLIVDAKLLSQGENVKQIYKLTLKIPANISYNFKPGDTIGIVTKNRLKDVTRILKQLNVEDPHTPCRIVSKGLSSSARVPGYLSKDTTLFQIFEKHLDVRSVPKKLFIRVMAEYTSDINEKNKLQELCSKEGATKYTETILGQNMTFLDLLLQYQTCCPPVARIIENLPRLLPRPYSIATSPLVSSETVDIVFSLIENLTREGLCTGMLKSYAKQLVTHNEGNCVTTYFRVSKDFNLKNDSRPIILVAPGTGVAPFIGFLAHLEATHDERKVILFYGCRYSNRDYLFKQELNSYLTNGTLDKLFVSFSRETNIESGKYVQDNIKKHENYLGDLIFNEEAYIYVCGDAKNMSKGIGDAFLQVFKNYKGLTDIQASEVLKSMKIECRYLEDSWI